MQLSDLSSLTNRQLIELTFDSPIGSPDKIGAEEELRRRHHAGTCKVTRERMAVHGERVALAVRCLLHHSKGAKAVQLRSTKDPRAFVVVSRDPMSPHLWRGSQFDERGPWGHFIYDSMEDVLRAMAGEWVKGPPRATLGEYVFESAIGQSPEIPLSADALCRRLDAMVSRENSPAIS